MKPSPVENLNNRVESVTLFVPSNERRVIVQDYNSEDGHPLAITAFYINGRWRGLMYFACTPDYCCIFTYMNL